MTLGTRSKSTLYAEGVNNPSTNASRIFWSKSLSTRPPYTDCLTRVRMASQGMEAGSTLARPFAILLSQVSMVLKAAAMSESLKSYVLLHPKGT